MGLRKRAILHPLTGILTFMIGLLISVIPGSWSDARVPQLPHLLAYEDAPLSLCDLARDYIYYEGKLITVHASLIGQSSAFSGFYIYANDCGEDGTVGARVVLSSQDRLPEEMWVQINNLISFNQQGAPYRGEVIITGRINKNDVTKGNGFDIYFIATKVEVKLLVESVEQ